MQITYLKMIQIYKESQIDKIKLMDASAYVDALQPFVVLYYMATYFKATGVTNLLTVY